MGPLDGLVVADFSRVLAGPYLSMMLADFGARVIKIERPGTGDDTRHWGPPYTEDGLSTYFCGVNRNKETVEIDLSTPEGCDQAREIAASADILIENFRPGTMARKGLDYDSLAQINPGLVYASLSGFGSKAGSDIGGYVLMGQAVGGLMSITGEPDQPSKVGVALVDVLTGLHLGLGVLAAINHRNATGEGQHIEINLLSSLLSSLTNQASAFVNAGVVAKAAGNTHPSIAPYQVFKTSDRSLTIAAGNDSLFRRTCDVLKLPELKDDPRFLTNADRVAHREELVALMDEVLVTASADHWFQALREAGVPAGPVNDIAQAFDFAKLLELDPVVSLGATKGVRNPVEFSRTPVEYRTPAPHLPSAAPQSPSAAPQSSDAAPINAH